MPSHRTTVTLDEEALTFLLSQAGSNKSSYINNLLKQEKQRVLAEAIFKANQEEAEDLDEAELNAEMEGLIGLANEFYDREMERYEKE